jgi:hypothetical protein
MLRKYFDRLTYLLCDKAARRFMQIVSIHRYKLLCKEIPSLYSSAASIGSIHLFGRGRHGYIQPTLAWQLKTPKRNIGSVMVRLLS